MTTEERHHITKIIQTALDRLNTHYRQHSPVGLFGLFSGGHDSFSATYVASLHPAFTAAVHINTGTGVKATRDYVLDTCAKREWTLREFKATENINAKGESDPQDYRQIVLQHGFPGPAGHGMMYSRLKQRAIQLLGREVGTNCRGKQKKRMMLVSGGRSQESTRRMGHVEECQVEQNRVWVAPIHDWTKHDTSLCLELANQPRNIVVDLIHKSGECLCGAFAKSGELEELALWPQTRPAYERIKALEAEVKPIHGWGWGERPPKKRGTITVNPPGPLCWSCGKQAELL